LTRIRRFVGSKAIQVVAADLLAQAEHDVAARAILVSTSLELIEKVCVGGWLAGWLAV
jgi:hypothetical protein